MAKMNIQTFLKALFRYDGVRPKSSLGNSICMSAIVGLLTSTCLLANPNGGRVVSGSAGITNIGNRMDINQTSDHAVINWRGFNIQQNEHVNFNQPGRDSAVLNRVTGNDPSSIYGKLTANGNVYLVNPNGIMFSKTAQINVGGLVASTANITNQNFMSGHMRFNQPGRADAKITNAGAISVQQGGLVALVAPGVTNQGTIQARLGKVSLAAGDAYTLDFYGDQLINLTVNKKQLSQISDIHGKPLAHYVSNSGGIIADGGIITLQVSTAKQIMDGQINQQGYIQAQSVENRNGVISLLGDAKTRINVSGKIDASSGNADSNGGKVEIRAAKVGLNNGAHIDVSSNRDGGTVLVGGDYQGHGKARNAQFTTVSKQAEIHAESREDGDGGKVIVWSDNRTRFDGKINAQGGINSGDGGLVEVSGKKSLHFDGDVDASSAHGEAGQLLLDPGNLTIASNTQSKPGPTLNDSGSFVAKANQDNVIDVQKVNFLMQSGTNVFLKAFNDLKVGAKIDGRAIGGVSGAGITLTGGRNVDIMKDVFTNNGKIKISAIRGDINMAPGKLLYAGDQPITLSAGQNINAQKLITSGALTLKAGNSATIAERLAAGKLNITAVNNINLNNACVTKGLNCKENAKVDKGVNQDLTITSSNGNITHTGTFVTDRNVNLQATKGAVTLKQLEVRKPNADLNVVANKDIVLNGNILTRNKGTQTYLTDTGNITFNGGVLATGGGLKVSATSTQPNQGSVTFNQSLGFAYAHGTTTAANSANSLGALNVRAGGTISVNKDVDIKGNLNPCNQTSDCSLKLVQLGDGDVVLNGKVEVHSGDVLLGREDLNTVNFGNGKIKMGNSLIAEGKGGGTNSIVLNGNLELFDSGKNPTFERASYSYPSGNFYKVNTKSVIGENDTPHFYALLDPTGKLAVDSTGKPDYSKIDDANYRLTEVSDTRLGQPLQILHGLDPIKIEQKAVIISAPNGSVKMAGNITGLSNNIGMSIVSKFDSGPTGDKTTAKITDITAGLPTVTNTYTDQDLDIIALKHNNIDIQKATVLGLKSPSLEVNNNSYAFLNQVGFKNTPNTYNLTLSELPLVQNNNLLALENLFCCPPSTQQTPPGINSINGQFGTFNNLNVTYSLPGTTDSSLSNNIANLTLNSTKTQKTTDSKEKNCKNQNDGAIVLESNSVGQSVDFGRGSPESGANQGSSKKKSSC